MATVWRIVKEILSPEQHGRQNEQVGWGEGEGRHLCECSVAALLRSCSHFHSQSVLQPSNNASPIVLRHIWAMLTSALSIIFMKMQVFLHKLPKCSLQQCFTFCTTFAPTCVCTSASVSLFSYAHMHHIAFIVFPASLKVLQ